MRDESDKHVLAAAIAAKCGFIVTGDKDLLSLKERGGIKIRSTAEILKRLLIGRR